MSRRAFGFCWFNTGINRWGSCCRLGMWYGGSAKIRSNWFSVMILGMYFQTSAAMISQGPIANESGGVEDGFVPRMCHSSRRVFWKLTFFLSTSTEVTNFAFLDKNSRAMIPEPENKSSMLDSLKSILFCRELNSDSLTRSVEGLT